MPHDSFLMKFLIKKRFVGPVNNARVPLEKHKSHRDALPKKKTQTLAFSSVSKWVLCFRFIQLRPFCKLLLKIFEKKYLENTFQSLIEFF